MKHLLTSVLSGAALAAGAADLADRVKADFKDYGEKPFVHYAVPPMSEVQRLADTYPHDGTPGGTVRIFAAKDEYEAGAFCVWGVKDLGKVRFEVGDFKQVKVKGKGEGEGQGEEVETGVVFPKDKLDLKVVKCWYQNLNGWFSYFGDNGDFKLCSELLLNDEDLIRCDEKTKSNYARITDEKGRFVREQWINAPRAMELRQSRRNGRNETSPFNPMAPGFDDAATLQPVTVGKEAFRCLFLTAHVTTDIPAGVYRGEVLLTRGQETRDGRRESQTTKQSNNQTILGSIPVEIHVASYVLPHPKCFREPDQDFYITFYHYNGFAQLMDENGGDMELAVKQMGTMIEDMVAHGQNIHPWCGIKVDELCVEKGMLPTVFFNGPLPYDKTREERLEKALRYTNEYDRRLGCHNLYNGWGDEPGCAVDNQFMNELAKYCAEWHTIGMKHFIASRDNLYRQVGFAADWVNISEEPTQSHPHLEMWNSLPGKRCAWYAVQHVGPECPALARRQNGLAPWLSGYTAFANYAHHLGPYNDQSEYYKPMVYAYGAHSGMIDTIAWEGFREGVDDIRYATLLAELARRAAADKDVEKQLLGQRALHYLSLVEKQTCDLDTVRAEMRLRIEGLLKIVPQDKVEPYRRLPSKPAAADAAFAKALAPKLEKLAKAKPGAERDHALGEIDKTYRAFFREKELADYMEKEGALLLAASAAAANWEFARAEKLRFAVLNDAKAADDARSSAAWDLVWNHPELWKDANLVRFLERKPAGWGQWQPLSDWAHFGPRFYESLAGAYRLNLKGFATAKNKTYPTDAAFEQGVSVFVATGDRTGVKDLIACACDNKGLAAASRYKAGLYAKLFGEEVKKPLLLGSRAQEVRDLVAAYEKENLKKEITTDQRVGAINDAGYLALLCGDNEMARVLEEYRAGLFKPVERRRYTVKFSAKPIEGVDWTGVDAAVSLCDRKFGGSKELLYTDVATGNRQAADTKAEDGMKPMKLQIAADAWGIHFRLESTDPKADEVASGALDGGSLETYVAPGKNKPYVTFSKGDTDNRWDVWNGVYDAIGQRRFDPNDANGLRAYTSVRDGRVVNMLSVSWDLYAEDIPHQGSVWDYEAFRWGRDECAWNGSRCIHERSTWGELVFELKDAERAEILRRVERRAFARFGREVNGAYFYLGHAQIWRDPNVGDIPFFKKVVEPWQTPLVEAGKKLGTADDATVFALEKDGTLSKWHNCKQYVDRLRGEWLAK